MIPAAMTSLDDSSEGWSFWNITAKAHLNEAVAEQQQDHALAKLLNGEIESGARQGTAGGALRRALAKDKGSGRSGWLIEVSLESSCSPYIQSYTMGTAAEHFRMP